MKPSEIIQINVTLKSGAEFSVTCTAYEAWIFHDRVHKAVSGLRARTDNYVVAKLNHQIFLTSEIASYYATDSQGSRVDLTTKV